MRAMALQYPGDPHATELYTQYMFGDSLLVAPVMEEGQDTKDIYFPEGSWLSLFGSDEVQGPRLIKVRSELEQIPVYMKQDSVAALNLAEDYRLGGHVGNRIDVYERLTIAVYICKEIHTRFEDDLGYSIDIEALRLESGDTRLSWSGGSAGQVTWMIRNQAMAATILCDGKPLEPVAELEALRPGACGFRDGDLFICTEGASGVLELLVSSPN